MVERRTVSQTVVHNHITQTVLQRVYPRRDTVLRVLSPPTPAEESEERARPTLWAKRLVRLFSTESARRELGQFFQGVVRTVLREEGDRARSRPSQEAGLIYHLLGRSGPPERVEREKPALPPRRPPQMEETRPVPLQKEELLRLVQGVERSLERKSRWERLRGEGL